jgi:hypothetical protein
MSHQEHFVDITDGCKPGDFDCIGSSNCIEKANKQREEILGFLKKFPGVSQMTSTIKNGNDETVRVLVRRT